MGAAVDEERLNRFNLRQEPSGYTSIGDSCGFDYPSPRYQSTTIGKRSGFSSRSVPHAWGEIHVSGETETGGDRRFASRQKPLIVRRFAVAVGATGQTKCIFD